MSRLRLRETRRCDNYFWLWVAARSSGESARRHADAGPRIRGHRLAHLFPRGRGPARQFSEPHCTGVCAAWPAARANQRAGLLRRSNPCRTCASGYYERETRDLVRINQCELMESFVDAQREYSSSLALGAGQRSHRSGLGRKGSCRAEFSLAVAYRPGHSLRDEDALGPGLFHALDRALGGMAAAAGSLRPMRCGFDRWRVRNGGAGPRMFVVSNRGAKDCFRRKPYESLCEYRMRNLKYWRTSRYPIALFRN